MSDTARQRSGEFLRLANQFRLGELVTEASHPVTRSLSDVAREDVAAALRLLFTVDGDVVRTYREVVESGRLNRISDAVLNALRGGGRLFFTGCGSTGRLSILLDSIWRDFWQQQRAKTQGGGVAAMDWENRTFSVMAGGDFALIKAVEGFEDYAAFGRKQMRDLGVRAGDVVFAITEGGETSFVIGTAWEGVDAGAKVYFVYNNPNDILCGHVQRSREVISDSRIEKLNLTTGPMAISGSTRMQATTIQLCVLITVLELAARRLLLTGTAALPFASNAAEDNLEDVPHRFLRGLEVLHQSLLGEEVVAGLALLVQAETEAYRSGGRTHYYADHFAIDVLTDTTERSPTFCTPPFRKLGDRNATESMSFLFVPGRSTSEAWRWLLKRSPRCLDWTRQGVEGLVPPEQLDRTMEVLASITEPELMRFGIGSEGLADRPVRKRDFCLTIAAEHEEAWPQPTEPQAPSRSVRCTPDEPVLVFGANKLDRIRGPGTVVQVPVPQTGLLLDGLTRAAVKMVLNALSTCVMVRLGRVMGNTMIYVVPSNLKLIDRATRYISRLADLDYEDANRRLFEAIEYVEPRMLAGRSYPPVVGLAVLSVRLDKNLAEVEEVLQAGGGLSSG